MFIEKEQYDKINRSFPLNAVELLIFNSNDEVLMVKRTNEPAKGQWWIPGGRVLFVESRIDAAKRLLKEECGIITNNIHEIEMFEYSVRDNVDGHYQHTISTVYKVVIPDSNIKIDSQSSEYAWKCPVEWVKLVEHDFLKQLLNQESHSISFMTKAVNRTEFISNELYSVILKSLSIPCVDLVVKNKAGEILLVNRKNEPAKDEWWVPGGRVLFGERREDAAKRKLLEECNLKANDFKKIGNFEFFFDVAGKKYHNIATLFEVTVDSSEVALDEQSSDYKWLKPEEWLKYNLSDFIRKTLTN